MSQSQVKHKFYVTVFLAYSHNGWIEEAVVDSDEFDDYETAYKWAEDRVAGEGDMDYTMIVRR